MVSSISREYVNMCLTGLPFRFRWALNQVFSSRLWLHSHHSKLSSPKSEANIQTFLQEDPDRVPVIRLDAMAPSARQFRWPDFYTRALMAISEPLIDYKVER